MRVVVYDDAEHIKLEYNEVPSNGGFHAESIAPAIADRTSVLVALLEAAAFMRIEAGWSVERSLHLVTNT